MSNLGLCKIYLTNADGSQSHRLTDADGIEPTWSPDGTRVVFSGNAGLFVVNADGSNLTQLTSGRDRSPAWSPDGAAIAFSRLIHFSPDRCAIIRLDAACPTDIMTVAPDGSNLRPVTRNQPLSADDGPAWSPDGGTLAYRHSAYGQPARMLTRRVGAASADTVRIDADVSVGSPIWSPDGRAIAFGARRFDGPSDVAIVPANGGTPVLIERPGSQSPSDWR
jgi:TolB protein